MNMFKTCPCQKLQCPHFGNCASCRAHHHTQERKNLTKCEWLEMKYESVLQELQSFAQSEPDIQAIFLVGSYARGTPKPTSDVDIVIVSEQKEARLHRFDWLNRFGRVKRIQTEYYGACTSLRVWFEKDYEVEFGLVLPSWLSLPLDDGTRRVLSDGYVCLAGTVDENLKKELANDHT